MTERKPTHSASTLDRSTFLGASEIAAVLGLSPWKTPLDVWSEKRGFGGQPGNVAMRVGQVLERPILTELYEAKGELTYPGTLLHRDVQWAGCTPDAFEDVVVAVLDLQVKVVGYQQARRWGLPEEGEMAVPTEVRMQVQWELEVADVTAARILALLGTDFRIYEVARDRELGADLLMAAEPFWMRNVVEGVMPEIDGSEASRKVIERYYGKEALDLAQGTPDARHWAERYAKIAKELKELESLKEEAGNHLRVLIRERAGLEWPDGSRVTWKTQAGRTRYSEACRSLLTAEQLEPFAGKPSRILRVNLKENE